MGDLIAFLTARLDEDEAAAPGVHDGPACTMIALGDPDGCDCGYPARVLRDVAAGRALLSMYQDAVAEAGSEAVEWMLAVIETKARVYDGHPDYDPAWAPKE